MRADPIPLRPHHGLCLRHFSGHGYSEAFTERMAGLVSELQESPEQLVTLHSGADFLCTACPHRRGDGCVSGEKVTAYDAAVLSLCGLPDGISLTWKTFSKLVEERVIQAGRFPEVCNGCQWYSLCEPLALYRQRA